MSISAIIMASGMSERMGEDKLKLLYKGKPIFQYVVDIVKDLDFVDKIIVTNDEEITKYSVDNGLRAIKNDNFRVGKSESIKIGVKNSSKDTSGYMFFVSDQPLLSKKTVIQLINCFEQNNDKIVYPLFNGKKGTPTIFPIKHKESFFELKGNQGGLILIDADNSISVRIDTEEEHFDIDTKEDYKKLTSE
ncbi:MAG: nucleotidyltransferase family protein [Tissierellia bacterium]|nr:nucleotidyltransferase family protein [Tissierellia bacterium]